MTTIPASRRTTDRSIVKTIAWVGLLAGSLDITAACVQVYLMRGTSPEVVLRYIAGAAFGKWAFSGGWEMPLAGLLFHFIIAYSFTILFFLLYPFIKILSKSVVATAIVYGIFIYVVMNLLVLPLTKIPAITFHLDKALMATAILIVAIGLPLSFFARKFYRKN
jgi:uncharacterized membrane protein YagU involved in acid resistance